MASGFPSEVASVIRGLLAEHNVSGARLAEALRRAPSYVSERQTGQRAWTMADIDVMAGLLDLEPTVLLAEVSRRARLAKDAREAAILSGRRPRPASAPDRTAQQPRRKRRSA